MGLQNIYIGLTRIEAASAAAPDDKPTDDLTEQACDLIDAMIATPSGSLSDLLIKIQHLRDRMERDSPYCTEEVGDDLIRSIAIDAAALLVQEHA